MKTLTARTGAAGSAVHRCSRVKLLGSQGHRTKSHLCARFRPRYVRHVGVVGSTRTVNFALGRYGECLGSRFGNALGVSGSLVAVSRGLAGTGHRGARVVGAVGRLDTYCAVLRRVGSRGVNFVSGSR